MGWLSDTWNTVKENASDVCHGVLDVAGFVPGFGAVPDLLNAGLYAAEGDWGNAGLSALAAIPMIGDAGAAVGKGGKYLSKGGKWILEKGGKLLKNRKVVEGLNALRKCKYLDSLADLKKLKKGFQLGKMKTGAKAGFQKGKSLFDAVAEKAKNWLKCEKGCFLEDTNVWTESGRKAIQQIQAGDLVYARDEETGEVGLKKVKQVYETEAHTVYTITLGEGETEPIRTTNYHPFYEKEKGWVCAIQLQVGDRLCTIEGEEEVVTLFSTTKQLVLISY